MRLPPDVAYAVLDALDADQSQFESRHTSRPFAVQPAVHLLLDGRLETCAQLFVQLAFCSLAAGQHPRTADHAPEPPHHNSPSEVFRIRPMAVAWTSQAWVSRLSMARPEVVSE